MAIITLSAQAFSGAAELSRFVSERLGYRMLSREDIIDKMAHYGVSRDRLDRARSRRLGVLSRMDLEWVHYLVYARAALSKEVRQGNLVFLGDNGKALLHDFPNLVAVNVVADIEYRIGNLIRRTDFVISRSKARRLIKKIDEKQAKWHRTIHSNGWHDQSDSDLDIELGPNTIPDAGALICEAMAQQQYRTTQKTLEAIDLLTVAAELRARIAMRDDVSDDRVHVEGRDGVIVVTGSVHSIEELNEIKGLLGEPQPLAAEEYAPTHTS